MKKWLSLGLLVLITIVFSSIQSASLTRSDLHIQLKNIRNSDGVIYVFLYNYENQYPRAPLTYYKVGKSKVKNGNLTVKIPNIEYNPKYAITLIDDENDNEDLDRFLGLPTEGFGFSNNVRPLISLPDYNDLLFTFSSEKTIYIDLQYFL
ncbi:MAG: DUF2141 domain-containing protein [Crocinitomicaceae bacterium]